MPNNVENAAIEIVVTYLEQQGYEVANVSRSKRRNPEHRGFDLVASRRDAETLKIEVKGCTHPWGIPDLYETEFDSDRQLIADFLYVVYFLNGKPPQLCAIPRIAIKPEHVRPKAGFRISSRFKNRQSLEPFLLKL
jgi:hypothetical protein